MNARSGRAARREIAVVVAVATCGIALASLVAFAPWYDSTVVPGNGAVIDQQLDAVPAARVVAGGR